MIDLVIDIVLLSFLIVISLAILKSTHLLAVAMLFGLYSLLVAGQFVVLDAPDVAFTEAAVGTGIATVLMLATLACTRKAQSQAPKQRSRGPFAMTLVVTAMLIYGTHDLPNIGEPTAPPHTEVASYYVKSGQDDTGVPNLVTAVLASYRGFDTLGEVTVVLAAGFGICLLLFRRVKPRVKAKPITSKPEQSEAQDGA